MSEPTAEELQTVYDAATAWLKRRNSLSADCHTLGISSSDLRGWVDELLRREKPFRDAMERIVYPGAIP